MHYIVAVQRERRDQAPSDWKQQVANVAGVTVLNHNDLPNLQIEVTDEGLDQLRRQLGDLLYIEPLVPHRPASGT